MLDPRYMSAALGRAKRLLGADFRPDLLPDVVHVLAAAGQLPQTPQLGGGSECVSRVVRPWGVGEQVSDGLMLRELRTLRTGEVHAALPEVNTSDDFFLLCLFRAAASHVLTSGANLRAEPDLEVSLFPDIFAEGADCDEEEDQEGEGLPVLRNALGLRNAAPVPIVLTRSGDGLDFTAPFFTNLNRAAQDPILLVSSEAARRDVQSRLAEVPKARAQVICAGGDGVGDSAAALNPTRALEFARENLGAQRVSVECGPSIAAELHAARTIKAVSLSILVSANHCSDDALPVITPDPLFDNRAIARMESQFKATCCEHDVLLRLKSSTVSFSNGAEFGWVYEYWE